MTLIEASNRFGFDKEKLLYYEKNCLFDCYRQSDGNIDYCDETLEYISLIDLLLETGLDMESIKNYINGLKNDSVTGEEQIKVLMKQRYALLDDIHDKEKILNKLDYIIHQSKKNIKEIFTMKKQISILLAFTMILALAACEKQTANNMSKAESTNSDIKNNEQSTDTANAPTNAVSPSSNVLVAYFSCTGTTKNVAEYIADSTSSDLYEIVPVDPYTDDDIDYNNENSRSTLEMNNPNSRPAILGTVKNMEQYDIIFIGYPIWWGNAPRIISTFLESYDFAGKTIIPFCTSASSGMGSSGTNLKELTSGATWLSGQRFGGTTSRSDTVSWINGLNLNLTAE